MPPLSYWKSVEELRADSIAHARRRREFLEPLPGQAGAEAAAAQGASRRDFLALMGFGLGAAACARAPVQQAIPFLVQPEEVTAGVARWYATACGGCSAGCGLLVKTRDGRPIKVEGNPDDPLCGGGTCAVGQATVLSLYDDGRLRGPLWQDRPVGWDELDRRVRERLAATMAAGGRVVLLSGPLLGPATRELVARWSAHYAGFTHVAYEPASLTALRRAHQECFGHAVVPHYRLDGATLIVGLEADFLGSWLSPVEFTRQYALARRLDRGAGMARHVQIETGLSLTGANADQRHAVAPSELGLVAAALLRRIQARAGLEPVAEAPDEGELPLDRRAVDGLAAELWRERGRCLVVCGAADPALQTVVAALNHLLGNVGRTVVLERPSLQKQADDGEMERLVEAMLRGDVQALILYGVNPAYDYPDHAAFVAGLERVALSISLADRLDETAARVHAVCPDHHFLEAWGDAEPVASHYRLQQPVVAPLFETRAAQESLLAWLGEPPDFHAFLREYWRRNLHPRQDGEPDFDRFWERTLQAGVLTLEPAGEAPPAGAAPAFTGDLAAALARLAAARRAAAAHGPERLELHFYETVALRDGRHANNPWLQELPDPVSKLTWGNALAVAPALAARLGVQDGDVVALAAGDARLELPACVQPGQSPRAVSVAVGYGRTRGGKVADGVGVSVHRLAPLADGVRRWWRGGFRLEKTGRREPLAATQLHHSLDGRPLVREAPLGAEREAGRPHAAAEAADAARQEPPSLWAAPAAGEHSWGMAIDLAACTGCSACVVACQAENNVAVVGKDEVRRGREMHWIRIDRYYGGSPEAPETVFQPVMCQHCGNAPCEAVCPVLATVHSSDGINQQVYNRCIGTRYCENNCPYKVRRFNWFEYARNPRFDFHMASPLGSMVLNPDVVVRSRGVMEKCSLCLQRVQAGLFAARPTGRAPADGAIQTACQQACPARAIVFGDLGDLDSRVSRLARSARHYHLLGGLGTRPHVGYLAKVRNREA